MTKSSGKVQTVLVIGGFGFIGRYVVNALKEFEVNVFIGTRGKRRESANNIRVLHMHKMTEVGHWGELLDGVDVVVNTVGILRQRFAETYEQVHHYSVVNLAHACAAKGIRFVHISALGLKNPVKSRFLTSKRRGEDALQKTSANWFLVRPSLVDEGDGYGARWLRRTATWPVHFAPSNAKGMLTPVDASDLGEAIARIALLANSPSKASERIYELGGEQKMNLFEYQNVLRKKPKHKRRIPLPAWFARMVSHICDLFHITPYSFGHYELLKRDNCPSPNRLSEVLGRSAKRL